MHIIDVYINEETLRRSGRGDVRLHLSKPDANWDDDILSVSGYAPDGNWVSWVFKNAIAASCHRQDETLAARFWDTP